MFTKIDYVDYCGQLNNLEREMIYRLQDDLLLVEDPSIRKIFEHILLDECRHYSYVKELIDDIFLKNTQEKTPSIRIGSLGSVQVTSSLLKEPITGYCIRAIDQFLYVEFDQSFQLTEQIELWITLFQKEERQHRTGKMVWSLNITSQISMVKIALL